MANIALHEHIAALVTRTAAVAARAMRASRAAVPATNNRAPA
jgi:hypothetical protein